MEKLVINWIDYIKLINTLAEKIRLYKQDFSGIIGVTRGGLIPAVLLSHKLNLPMLNVEGLYRQKVLLVDDVSDTGKTLQEYSKKIHGFGSDVVVATLHMKPHTEVTPHFYVEVVPDNVWLIYPYEEEVK